MRYRKVQQFCAGSRSKSESDNSKVEAVAALPDRHGRNNRFEPKTVPKEAQCSAVVEGRSSYEKCGVVATLRRILPTKTANRTRTNRGCRLARSLLAEKEARKPPTCKRSQHASIRKDDASQIMNRRHPKLALDPNPLTPAIGKSA